MNPHSLQSSRSKTQRQQSLRAANFAYLFSRLYIRSFLRIWPILLTSYLVTLILWMLLLFIELSVHSNVRLDVLSYFGVYLSIILLNPVVRFSAIVLGVFLAALLTAWCRKLLLGYRRDARLLRYIDAESSDILTQTLANPQKESKVRVYAAYALSEQTTPAIRALQRALTDPEPAIGKAASTALLIALRDHISAPSVLNSLPISDLAENLEAVLAAERALVALKRYYDEEEQSAAREIGTDSEDNGVLIAEQAQAALEKIGVEAPYAQILTIEPNESADLMYDLTH